MSKVYRSYYHQIMQDVENGLISLEDLQDLINLLQEVTNES